MAPKYQFSFCLFLPQKKKKKKKRYNLIIILIFWQKGVSIQLHLHENLDHTKPKLHSLIGEKKLY